ncbi:hypothetical protein [Candidatus Arthromitus sp. SFB-turkey]|uniref:hypothetical protein n=1 Tax=Candidatus Arthromitus sp. SFB-turkey TaxID=1840217 RepID=UPI0007F4C706|nr:hypothetical protein [Candidatus Arthromitus sp. SFB-turkey]OAT87994.1 hypothetical protein A6P36_02240 [Candidatus Arthromitus sp. SFB-turkey]HJC99832.1 hypothetical protein [Candidatus Dwaynia gallinarum]
MYSDYRILKFILIILYCVIFIKNIEYVLFSVLAICIHELAHIVFLKISGVSIVNFKVSFLGFEIYLREKKCINRELIVYFVGSLSNILIGILFLVIKNIFTVEIFDKFIIVNFVIGFVNLIPVFPLDGAIILKNILFRKFRLNTAVFISIFVSVFLAIIILIFIMSLFLKFSFINITYVVVFIFVIVSTYKEYRLFISTFVVSKIDYKKYLFLKEKYLKTVLISVTYDTELLDLIRLYKFSRFSVFCFLDGELKIIGMMNEFNVLECYKKFGNITIRKYYEKNLK